MAHSNNLSIYPTQREILNRIKLPDNNILTKVEDWKMRYYYKVWSKFNNNDKLKVLQDLSNGLVTPTTTIEYLPTTSWSVTLDPENQNYHIMTMDRNNPSIISLLHEVGHIIHGKSELEACIYSVSIFKNLFPKEYSRLTWNGHMLKKV